MIHSYPEFINNVEESFSRLIESYGFQLTYRSEAKATLSNIYCSIEFNMDRMDLDILIRVKGELFLVLDVLSFLRPDIDWDNEYKIQLLSETNTYSSKKKMMVFAFFIEKYLKDTLEGNTNWVSGLKKRHLYDQKIRRFVWRFPAGHQLYYIMGEGKSNWIEKVIEYCIQNNIEYPLEDD